MKISLRINPQKENKNKKSLIPERGKGFFFLIKVVVSIIVVIIIAKSEMLLLFLFHDFPPKYA